MLVATTSKVRTETAGRIAADQREQPLGDKKVSGGQAPSSDSRRPMPACGPP
jgi:hypothetical protein